MGEQVSAYAEVLADLERERDGINAAIEVIRRKMGMSGDATASSQKVANGGGSSTGTSATGSAGPQGGGSSEIKPDTFFGMKVPEAVRAYLNMTKRPARASVISKALVDGGVQSTSSNFAANVQTALHRMPEAVRVPNGWGLAEWYPGRNFDKLKGKKGSADGAD